MLRLLLDQNFPPPVVNVEDLDHTIEYVHLSRWRPEFANVSTPDWLIHLAADADGFDGLISSDYNQLDQDEEVVALACTTLSVVTWSAGVNNPVTQWGSLLAYMPQIRAHIEREGPTVFTLPVPRLRADHHAPTAGISRRYTSTLGMHANELRSQVLPDMKDELRARGLDDLAPRLDTENRRPKRRAGPKARPGSSAPDTAAQMDLGAGPPSSTA